MPRFEASLSIGLSIRLLRKSHDLQRKRARTASASMRPTVLLVDDNETVIATSSRFVRRRGFEPLVATTYERTLRVLETLGRAPTAAILDVYLGGGHTGFEVLDLLRRRFEDPVPAVLLTGYDLDEIRPLADEFNVETIRKPAPIPRLDDFLVSVTVTSVLWRNHSYATVVERFCRVHRLCCQEARIVACLANGSTRANLPEELEISANTLKSQIKRLLAKLQQSSMEGVEAMLRVALRDAWPRQ